MLRLRLQFIAHARAAGNQDVEALRAVGLPDDVQHRVDSVLRLLVVPCHDKWQDRRVAILRNERRVVRLIEVRALCDDPGTKR